VFGVQATVSSFRALMIDRRTSVVDRAASSKRTRITLRPQSYRGCSAPWSVYVYGTDTDDGS
jgi:hypothetical protein